MTSSISFTQPRKAHGGHYATRATHVYRPYQIDRGISKSLVKKQYLVKNMKISVVACVRSIDFLLLNRIQTRWTSVQGCLQSYCFH